MCQQSMRAFFDAITNMYHLVDDKQNEIQHGIYRDLMPLGQTASRSPQGMAAL